MGTALSDLLVPVTDGFRDKELFGHFHDRKHPKCFACNSELMLVRPLVVNDRYILMNATTRRDGAWYFMSGCWLVFPRPHVIVPEEMPADWSMSLGHVAHDLGLRHYNASQNWGTGAGQTIEHAHTWIIDRMVTDPVGSFVEGKGMATILLELAEHTQ